MQPIQLLFAFEKSLCYNRNRYILQMEEGFTMSSRALTNLSTTDILEKEFRTELRGYSTNEVDEFLDDIIGDYTKLYKEIERLNEELKTMKLAGLKVSGATSDGEATGAGASNYDLIRRMSLLEKQVVEIMNHLKRKTDQETTQTDVTPTPSV